MFLHKQGCKYYQVVFKNLEHETNAVMKGNSNNSSLSIYDCLNSNRLNPMPHLTELHKHVENIEAHIASEKNVLNGFVNKLHEITFIDMRKKATDPEFAELALLTQHLKNLESKFYELKEYIVRAQELIQREKDKKDDSHNAVSGLIECYKYISQKMEDIYSSSVRLAQDFQKYTFAIQKEKELIQKEEQSATDFNKNFMSWFT